MSPEELNQSLPLMLALAAEPDHRGYIEVVDLARQISESYDPLTQTSNMPAYAGTNGTVCYRGTGTVIWPDSNYPTDDA